LRSALATREKLLGDRDPEVAESPTAVAAASGSRIISPRPSRCTSRSRDARAVFGERHLATVINLNNLGLVAWRQERYPRRALQKRALAVRELRTAPEVAKSLNNLAEVYKRWALRRRRAIAARALAIRNATSDRITRSSPRRSTTWPTSTTVRNASPSRAAVPPGAGDPGKSYGPRHRGRQQASNLASLLDEQGQSMGDRNVRAGAVDLRAGARSAARLAITDNNLGEVYQKLGRRPTPARVARWRCERRRIEHPYVAYPLANLGNLRTPRVAARRRSRSCGARWPSARRLSRPTTRR
jgi:hypothetical protein